MDNSTLLLILVLILAAVVIAGFLFFRSSVRAKITGPGVGMEFEGKGREPAASPPAAPAPPPPAPGGVKMTDIEAGRNVLGHAKTGGDVEMGGIKAEGDVKGITEAPPADPKAPPPA